MAALVGAGALTAVPANAAPLAPLSASLVGQLATATGAPLPVMVHGASLADAQQAVAATGMQTMTTFRKIGVVVALGTPAQIDAARSAPGVTYLEGNQPIEFFTDTSHQATRGTEAIETLTDSHGVALDGTGVSVAVIDTGVDPNHPAFADGKVVANMRNTCALDSSTESSCVVALPSVVDTDTTSLGGHGTHVSGIAVGNQVTLSDGTTASGAAPGARLVSIATGLALAVLGADAALNWVLENHEAPCGEGVPAEQCPPIRVVNNSYGPTDSSGLDENSTTVKLQRQLAAEGVVTVWAAGNDGGDGAQSATNPYGQDPTGGVLSVASYNDQDNGTRDGAVSNFSSRGAADDPMTWPDLSAPGENITSACRPYLPICSTGFDMRNGPGALDVGTYNTISGTSMAAPHISGIVAQLFQAAPDATPAQIEDALRSTAYRFADGADYSNVGGELTSYDKGTGLVDVVAAAESVGAIPR